VGAVKSLKTRVRSGSNCLITKAARETRLIVTIEDHNIIGGLGDAVAEAVARMGVGVKVLRLGLPDIYAAIGDPEDLFRKYGMTDDGIIRRSDRLSLPDGWG
jgi:transketolase